MNIDIVRRLNIARDSRRAAATFSDLVSGSCEIFIEGEGCPPAYAAVFERGLTTGASGMVEVDGRALFMNAYLPATRIVVIGAVRIAESLAGMATIVGHEITIVDPRETFAKSGRFGEREVVVAEPEDAFAMLPLDRLTALVAVSHAPEIDDYPLQAALEAGCFYVGALGSRRSHEKRVERLLGRGLAREAIARISAPIGLDIHAVGPAEIAVSIMAEIIETLRSRATDIA